MGTDIMERHNRIDNLKKNSDRTPTERKELARKAGIASGNARREKKKLRELVETFGELPAPEKITRVMTELGVSEKDMRTNNMAIVVGLFQKAIKGDVFAFNAIRDIKGEKPIERADINGNVNSKIEIGFVSTDHQPAESEDEVEI